MAYSPLDRKILLLRKGLQYRKIAEACGVDDRLVGRVIQGQRRCGPRAKVVMAYIATRTRVPLKRLFPEAGVDRRYRTGRSPTV